MNKLILILAALILTACGSNSARTAAVELKTESPVVDIPVIPVAGKMCFTDADCFNACHAHHDPKREAVDLALAQCLTTGDDCSAEQQDVDNRIQLANACLTQVIN